ncbi:PLP-dependent aminotransferase family protein [Stenotrophomonas maltophilia]|uniref:aminotransferase-like domain-containing protein n=1 Tax=Stenotrophomonas maltophilia TaxID=40324 RepID=UPI0028B1E521|nr:PLP-dependent aminotransferase family protein [Stenotrophomonas geniculata]
MDLSIVKPNLELQEPYVRSALTELAQAANLPDMLDYTPDGGLTTHREAGATWMRSLGFDANPEQTVLVAGAQHGLWVAINAMTRPGDLILCEAQCYPGIAAAALRQGRRVIGVEMDEYGIRSDHLRELCTHERPSLLVCVASLQNPTTAIMPVSRRVEIAEIAREFDFALLDDDLYGFLLPEAVPPLSNFAPERSIYITSLSKSVASSVRTGYLHCPPEWLPRMTAAVRASIWMVSPLSAHLGTLLIQSDKAYEMARLQRDEAAERQVLASKLLRNFEYRSQPTAFHLWLKLPQHASHSSNFVNLARSHRLLIAGGDEFCMNRCEKAHRHIRIALMSGSRQGTAVALTKLAGLLDTDTSIWL